jgi:hypothetical protein
LGILFPPTPFLHSPIIHHGILPVLLPFQNFGCLCNVFSSLITPFLSLFFIITCDLWFWWYTINSRPVETNSNLNFIVKFHRPNQGYRIRPTGIEPVTNR